jgi:capsid protein
MVDTAWDSDWTSGTGYAERISAQTADNLATPQHSASSQLWNASNFDGEKFPGGLMPVNELFGLDYWALRERSNELFHKNAYARGIVRRIVTNVIYDGLHLEATPEKNILNLQDEFIDDWSERVESRFYLYNQTPEIIDFKKRRNGGELQAQIKTEAIISGDCLVVLRQSPKYRLPTVEIISGDRVQTPVGMLSNENIIDGVELDKSGRHVAFYVIDDNNSLGYTKILARGRNTGRLQARLIYGCDKREDGVRGVPLLAIAIQPLAEIDRHRDSAQRKATLNSVVVAAVERGANAKAKSKPLTGKANRRDAAVDIVDAGGNSRRVSFADMIPGMNFENLNPDEKITFFNNNGVDINFGAFEAAILMGVAWALEIPPEILLLSFNKNYSASQAAINEFEMYLGKERTRFGAAYCDMLYQDWFMSMVLMNRIEAGSYLQDMMDTERWEYARAWTLADWAGHVKPATDPLKRANAYEKMLEIGATTYARATRELTGMKFTQNVRQQKKERQMLADAMRPLIELEMELKDGDTSDAGGVEKTIGAVSPMNIFSMTQDEIDKAKSIADTYGVLVRAGSATPQEEDETFFRKLFAMSPMSKNAKELWKSSNGVRRPITLAKEEAQTAEEVDSGEIDEPNTTDKTEKRENQEGAV